MLLGHRVVLKRLQTSKSVKARRLFRLRLLIKSLGNIVQVLHWICKVLAVLAVLGRLRAIATSFVIWRVFLLHSGAASASLLSWEWSVVFLMRNGSVSFI